MLLDIFNNRLFRGVSLSSAMQRIPYHPMMLGQMNLFNVQRRRTRQVAVKVTEGRVDLIPISPIGAAPKQLEKKPGKMRIFEAHRLAEGSTIYAEEVQGIINIGDETVRLASMQEEVVARGQRIRDDMELTHEHMRLGAVFGKVMDADGTTVIDDWFENWGIEEPAPIDMGLDDPNTDLRAKHQTLIDTMRRNSRGGWRPGARVHALAAPDYFDKLLGHPYTREAIKNSTRVLELLEQNPETVDIFGVVYHRYFGSDTGELEVPAGQARFFPVGTDAFEVNYAPAEFAPFVNQPGQDIYALTIPDRDRQAFVTVEGYCYPLYVCRRPEMLLRGQI
ncbi:major capsid protein [Microvirga sp. Mcv34]|uniref:major capsid protein n=1 Tax=Microvirga sp. Mcv34 TaxID=2926016 RepID=UPI0021C8EB2E|nr:major capsid protein [Microvirga sp. Mcv34]